MYAYLVDDKFNVMSAIDDYKSFLWTDRYNSSGQFQLVVKNTAEKRAIFEDRHYVINSEVEKRMMVLENIDYGTEFITVSGRSLDSILDRRVITSAIAPTGLLHLLYVIGRWNAGFAAGTDRTFGSLYFYTTVPSGFTDPPDFDGVVPFGENLHSAYFKLLKAYDLGVYVEKSPGTVVMYFRTYFGEDLTYGGNRVVFSASLGNISDVHQLKSERLYRNVAVTNLPPWDDSPGIGELFYSIKPNVAVTGYDRREIWVDGSILRQDDTFTAANKPGRAVSLGFKELGPQKKINSLDFSTTPFSQYKYGEHYNLGDIVSVITPEGKDIPHRVTEFIHSMDENGFKAYPTLTAIE